MPDFSLGGGVAEDLGGQGGSLVVTAVQGEGVKSLVDKDSITAEPADRPVAFIRDLAIPFRLG